jgi:hypothetical protein
LARDAAQLVRSTESDFLFQRSMRVNTADDGESHLRYEVGGANAARDLLRGQGISEAGSERIWLAIALHTTN